MADVSERKPLLTVLMIRRRETGEWFSAEFGWSPTLSGATAFTSVKHMVVDPEWEVIKFVEVPF